MEMMARVINLLTIAVFVYVVSMCIGGIVWLISFSADLGVLDSLWNGFVTLIKSLWN